MKKTIGFFSVLILIFITINLNAQTKPGAEYFAGKWTVLIKATPNGDAILTVNLEIKDSMLIGFIQDTSGTEIAKISKVDFTEQEITVYFSTQGYDVNLNLAKKDDDNIIGSLMGMFEAEGVRVKP